jgi:hypothetical protein
VRNRATDAGVERFRNADVVATYGKGKHAGALAAAAWLSSRGLLAPPGSAWEVSIGLDVAHERARPAFDPTSDTRFHLAISATEWGFFFCHGSRASWIRVTDVPFVHERDDFKLLRHVPALRDVGKLVQLVEDQYDLEFRRQHAWVRTSCRGTSPGAEEVIRIWTVAAL